MNDIIKYAVEIQWTAARHSQHQIFIWSPFHVTYIHSTVLDSLVLFYRVMTSKTHNVCLIDVLPSQCHSHLFIGRRCLVF